MERELDLLVEKLVKDLHKSLWETSDGEDLDIEKFFSEDIMRFERVDFLTALFRKYSSSKLDNTLLHCAFIWKTIALAEYLAILRNLSGAYSALYEIILFGGCYLAIDVHGLIESSSDMDEVAKQYIREHFPARTPGPTISTIDRMAEIDVDCQAIWSRLAQEGAPMKPFEHLC